MQHGQAFVAPAEVGQRLRLRRCLGKEGALLRRQRRGHAGKARLHLVQRWRRIACCQDLCTQRHRKQRQHAPTDDCRIAHACFGLAGHRRQTGRHADALRGQQGTLLRAPLQRIGRIRHLRIVVDRRLALADQHPPVRVAHATIGQETHRIGLLGPLRQRAELRIVDLEAEMLPHPLHMPHQVIARLRHLPIAGLIHVADKAMQVIDQRRIGMVAVLHGSLRQKVRPQRRAQRGISIDHQ